MPESPNPVRREMALYDVLTALKGYALDIAEVGEFTYEQLMEQYHEDLRVLGVLQAEIDDAGWWDE